MTTKEQFERDAELILSSKDELTTAERIKKVEDLTEWYFDQTGKHYKGSYYLERLGSYILSDELRDRSTFKVKNTEYPILSETQQKFRHRRESRVGDDNMDFIKLKAVDNHPNYFKKVTRNKDDI